MSARAVVGGWRSPRRSRAGAVRVTPSVAAQSWRRKSSSPRARRSRRPGRCRPVASRIATISPSVKSGLAAGMRGQAATSQPQHDQVPDRSPGQGCLREERYAFHETACAVGWKDAWLYEPSEHRPVDPVGQGCPQPVDTWGKSELRHRLGQARRGAAISCSGVEAGRRASRTVIPCSRSVRAARDQPLSITSRAICRPTSCGQGMAGWA